MEVKVLYFAAAREAVGLREETLRVEAEGEGGEGTAEVEVEVEVEGPTLGDLRRVLCARHPQAAAAIADVALALNLEYAGDDAVLRPGDEVALIPPISGG